MSITPCIVISCSNEAGKRCFSANAICVLEALRDGIRTAIVSKFGEYRGNVFVPYAPIRAISGDREETRGSAAIENATKRMRRTCIFPPGSPRISAFCICHDRCTCNFRTFGRASKTTVLSYGAYRNLHCTLILLPRFRDVLAELAD